MNDYLILIFFSLIGGLFSLAGGILFLSRKKMVNSLIKFAMPFAAGALLAAVFLDLLPEGIEEDSAAPVLTAALTGILLFFIADRFLRWFHHHHSDESEHTDSSIPLIIAGDTLHNALDGVAIAAAFLVSVPTGIVTTLAVAAHEIPQEIGDFGLLLSKGMKRKDVLIVNILSSLATVAAAVVVYTFGSEDVLPVGLLLGLSAGFLLYIALSDVIPAIHAKADNAKLIHVQTVLLLAGVVVVGILVYAAHNYIDVGHDRQPENAETLEHDHHE